MYLISMLFMLQNSSVKSKPKISSKEIGNPITGYKKDTTFDEFIRISKNIGSLQDNNSVKLLKLINNSCSLLVNSGKLITFYVYDLKDPVYKT